MAFRKPILLGVDGEARMVLKESKSGWFFEPENENQLAELMGKCLEDNIDLKEIGERGYHYAYENYNREKIASDYYQTLSSMV